MTKEELFRGVGEVREDQITEAETVKKISRPWRRYRAMAACVAVVLAIGVTAAELSEADRWRAIVAHFQPGIAVKEDPDDWQILIQPFNPESAAQDSGGGAETGTLDGAEYWTDGEKRPASHYSTGVEIGELDMAALKRAEGDPVEISSSACLVWLSPEEIFSRDTAIFRGTVRELRYYVVEIGGYESQYTVASVEVTDRIRGDVMAGEVRTVLYMGGPNMTTSISGPLNSLETGSDAIFMPAAATEETGELNGNRYFCYADLAEFYFCEGMRFVFLDTGDGLEFERGLYEDIAEAETLEEVADYIRGMIGEERSQIAAVPAEPQPAPADTADIDPAQADPSYGVPGPAGARELPGGAIISD